MAARTVRIHLSTTAVIVPLMLFVCCIPLATAGGWWGVLFAVPALALLVVVFAGTTATATGLSVRWLRGRVRVPWERLDRIEFPDARWAVAVTTSGRRVVLPGVRPADLPRIVTAAGSRLFLRRPVTEQRAGGVPGTSAPDETTPASSIGGAVTGTDAPPTRTSDARPDPAAAPDPLIEQDSPTYR